MNQRSLFDACRETAAQATTAARTRRSFRIVRSFDLRSALASHADREASLWDCECPHPGTVQCTCQFVVLLVYGNPSTRETFGSAQDRGSGRDPVVVTAHSREAQAHAQIVRDATTKPDPRLAEKVMAALVEAVAADAV